MLNHLERLKKRNNPNESESIRKFEKRLSKGLLMNYNKNKQSKFKLICDLFLKDHCEYLEKRRLLSLFQSIWGTNNEWNVVSKQTIGKKPGELMESAEKHLVKIPEGKGGMPRSIRDNLTKLIEKQREAEEKDDEDKAHPQYKFLNALMKPYSELHPVERLELYQNEATIYETSAIENSVKRNIILSYQWRKMETLWFQENKRSHPYMKKPYNDPEIEADLKILMEKLNINQRSNAGRNISDGSKELFRIQNQS